MKKNFKLGLIFLVVLLSCKNRQIVHKTPFMTPQNQTFTAEQVVNQVIRAQSELSFINITSAETTLSLDNKNFSLKCSVKIIEKQEITISVLPVLGVEMFRIQFKPTNFYVFDKLNRQYCEGNYEHLTALCNVEIFYEILENLLTNRLFTLSKESLKNGFQKVFSVTQLPEKYILKENKKTGKFTHFFDILPDFVVSATSLNEEANEVLSVNYSDFDIKNRVLFPMKIDIKANFNSKRMNAVIDIRKIEINKKFEVAPLDISRYKKVDLKSILP
jgi:hypothetical protein